MAGYIFRGVVLSVLTLSSPSWAVEPDRNRTVNPNCVLEPEANCSWGDLRGAKAAGMDLQGSSYLSALLDDADFQGANLEQSQMQLTSMKRANMSNANLTRSHMHAIKAQGINLQGANLDDVNLTSAELQGANLKGASINRVLWLNAQLSGATWTDGRICAEGSRGECK